MRNNKPLAFITLFIVVTGLSFIHFSSKMDSGNYEAPSRATELGKISATGERKGEAKVLLNDPAMKRSWGNKLIDTQKAWRISQGSKEVVVAVIDTGIDINHPDIKNNLWKNPNPSSSKSLGMKGDIHGWNFVDNNNDLTDNHGHGTHIAGILGAVGGNGIGISGVAPKVSIMALKYYDPLSTRNNNLRNTIKAFEYAIQNRAHIINYSGGGTSPSSAERAVIAKAQKLGILVVAAAGNESSNADVHGFYPARYELDNIISVTAIDRGKKVLSTSNYGSSSVDIAAPGNNIYSTLPINKGKYGEMTGTSQATAFVSGVAALIKAKHPTWKAPQIIKYLKKTGDYEPSLVGKTLYSRKINTYKALAILDQGIGLSGVIAENTATMDAKAFSSERGVAQDKFSNDSSGNLASFGSDFKKHMAKDLNKRKLADKNKKTPSGL